jgi:hypothetical protein
MILEEIEVENFLSHGHSKVCFTDSSLWLINGENGAENRHCLMPLSTLCMASIVAETRATNS